MLNWIKAGQVPSPVLKSVPNLKKLTRKAWHLSGNAARDTIPDLHQDGPFIPTWSEPNKKISQLFILIFLKASLKTQSPEKNYRDPNQLISENYFQVSPRAYASRAANAPYYIYRAQFYTISSPSRWAVSGQMITVTKLSGVVAHLLHDALAHATAMP